MTRPVRYGPLASLAIVLATTAAVGFGCGSSSQLSEEETTELVGALQSNGMLPDEYVLSKFQDHDVVILGEFHRIAEDVRLVTRIIPRLYHEAGVRVIGFEFLCADDQLTIDSLVTRSLFDESTAVRLQRRYAGGTWPYREYLDLTKVVWDVNRKLEPGQEPLRLIGLSTYIDWYAINHGDDASRQAETQKLVNTDGVMATAVDRYALARNAKALIYCGYGHAFTGFDQPVARQGQVVRVNDKAMGNLLRTKYGDRVITVLLHAPWPGLSPAELFRPLEGTLDQVAAAYGDSVGFDVPGSAFAGLKETRSVYGAESPGGLPFGNLCDGYVISKPIPDLTGVTVMQGWISSDADLLQAQRQLPDPKKAESLTSVRDFQTDFQRDAALQIRFEAVK